MGRIRKTVSLCTFGLVRFRNNRERQIAVAKKANKIAKHQAQIDTKHG